MLQTEFVRSLNCNYERILLETDPEEQRYQYCMVSRGGIKGLLDCSLRYINGQAYLYYDISSRQSVVQLSARGLLNRQWVRNFFWSMEQIREELARFLLEEKHVLWYPEQIFQDLESKDFYFLYVPYYEEDNGFGKLLEFLVEHIDYGDEALVECVYRMYEQFEKNGWSYLQSQIFHDARALEQAVQVKSSETQTAASGAEWQEASGTPAAERQTAEPHLLSDGQPVKPLAETQASGQNTDRHLRLSAESQTGRGKKTIISILKSRKKKERNQRESYQNAMEMEMLGYAVAEDTPYGSYGAEASRSKEASCEEDWGRTVYVEAPVEETQRVHSLYTREGRLLTNIEQDAIVIGKKKEEADVVLEDISVSRMHARILREADGVYIEDLNSTNGTFKNGLPLEPYEKRLLQVGDEIRIGKKELLYR